MRATSAIGLWSRSDLRARVVSLIVLALVAGLTAGLAVAAFDGARRTDTAFDRLRDRTNASDAVVFASQVGLDTANWPKLAARPEIAHLVRWGLAFGSIGGQGNGGDDVFFVPTVGGWLTDVDRPVVVAGRMFDVAAPDEMIVTDDAAASENIHVGDVVPFSAMGATNLSFDGPPTGPAVQLTVVGIVHTPLSYVFTGGGFLSPAFATTYAGKAYISENAVVQLRNGAADVAALRRDANADLAEGIPVLDLHVTARRVLATTDVEHTMLLLLAGIIAAAGLVFVGQALARSSTTIATDTPTLRALGMTPGDIVQAAVLPHLLTAALAAVVTAATAVIASRWFPVGLAAQVDPDRGIRADVPLIALAAGLVAVLVVLGSASSSWFAVRSHGADADHRTRRSSRAGLVRPLAVGLGVRLALGGGTRSGRAAARPALIGAVAAVAGLVAIITLNHGLNDSLAHPAVAGVAWDATVMPLEADLSETTGIAPAVVEHVAGQPGIAAAGTVGRLVDEIGDVGVPTFTVLDNAPSGVDDVRLVTLTGRAPQRADEIVLGPSTAADLGVGIGDQVTLADGQPAVVVGTGLFPSDVHAQFDEGALVTPDRFFGLLKIDGDVSTDLEFVIAVRFADESDLGASIEALGTAVGPSVAAVFPVDQPEELSNLHNVRRLPTVLAIFLTLLGVAAVGHALFSSVRTGRKDFAVLRALGFTRGGSRAILAANGTVVALVGLVVGIPIGIVAGRSGWRAITDRVPLVFHSPFTIGALVLVVPLTVLVANALAVLPGHRAARVEPAIILRSE